MNILKVDDLAPHFSLLNQNNELVSSQDFIGKKILLYFYPKALTAGCTIQACSLKENKAEFEKFGITIIGISPDSPLKLANFITKKGLNFNLLSDEDHKVAEKFGVWGEKQFMGKTYNGINRTSFLIDEEGKIKYIFKKFKVKEHHKIVLDYLMKETLHKK